MIGASWVSGSWVENSWDVGTWADVTMPVITPHHGGALRDYLVPITDNDDDLLLAAWLMFMTQPYEVTK